MKTIFITSFHPLISRNIISTDIIPLLLKKGIRVVLPIPHYKKEYFQALFGELPGLCIEGVDYNRPSGYFLGRLFKRIFNALLVSKNIEVNYRRKILPKKNFLYRFFFRFVNFLGRLRLTKGAARFFFFHFSPSGFFDGVFKQYNPSLVVVTDLHNENDVAFMQDARRRKIPIVGIVRSWDHLASKGLLKVVPDFIFAANKFLKEDAVRFHGVPEEKVYIVGIPHYDRYFMYRHSSRADFAKRIGVDPQKRFVLYTPFGSRYTVNNTVDRDVIDCISRLLPSTHVLIVRFPPTDSVDLYDMAMPPPGVVYDRPGAHLSRDPAKFIKNELTPEDELRLCDTLFFSDVVVTGTSTIAIDAAIFDKPTLVVAFDGYGKMPYDQSIRRYFEYEYFQPLLRSGGMRFAENLEDFRKFLALYLEKPATDAAGRRRIIEEQCTFTDGKSGERVSNLIYKILEKQ